ncbi:MAG TPA: hypothetical protein VND94_23370 [Terriglobia bacterium]|nr:hypothetical protein [Terriglobia bacterium]
MNKLDPSSIPRDGLTLELLRSFQMRLDAVIVAVRQMRDIATGQKHAFRRLDALEGMEQAGAAAGLPAPAELQDLKQVILLISRQSAAIDCIARLIDLMASRLHRPFPTPGEPRRDEAARRAPPDAPPDVTPRVAPGVTPKARSSAAPPSRHPAGARSDDGTVAAQNRIAGGLDSAVILLFNESKNQAAASRKAAAEIGEAFEMLAVIEEQAVALAAAQALTTDMLRSKLGALVTA